MRKVMLLGLVPAMLSACGGPTAPDAASCAAICDEQVADAKAATTGPTSGPSLTEFESTLLGPHIEDLRSGVRPFDDQGIGICKGSRECDEYLGTEVGELPPGKYIVKAELRVPQIGDAGTWKVIFDTECTTTRKTASGETTSTSNNSREYEVRYAGSERGYRLMPLRTIESPSSGGHRACTWKITAPHPDGDKVYSGSWSTPDAE